MKFTQEQVDNRTSDDICFDCGHEFLTEKEKQGEGRAVTAHLDICGLCGEEKLVTDIRHFNYLRLPKNQTPDLPQNADNT